jgi:hypothetical protein
LAYESKTWVDRVTEYPNRRLLTETGIDDTYEVTRAEGTITAEGDKINMTNLNGLETRVSTAFKAMGVDTYVCTKTGTVYDLANSNYPPNGSFVAPAAYVAGDAFRVNPSDQKFNSALAVAGYIDNTDGTLKASGVSNYSSPLIIISPSTAYKIVGHTYTQPTGNVGLAWYNSSGVYISGVNYGSATGNGTYTSPTTAYYVRYTINTANLSVSIFELNSSANTSPTYTATYTIQTSSGATLASGAFASGATINIALDITNKKIIFQKLAYTAAEVEAVPISHLTDLNNPHGVTAAQAGAMANNLGTVPTGTSVIAWCKTKTQSGHFYTNAGATDLPAGNYNSGLWLCPDVDNGTIIMVDHDTGKLYTNREVFDVWTGWKYSGDGGNAATLGGYEASLIFKNANTIYIPVVNADGTIEFGERIDMHLASSTNDYDARIAATANGISVYPLTASATANVVRNFQSNTSTTPSSWAEGDLYGYHA